VYAHAQTIYYQDFQENLAFCVQLCTVTSLVFFPYSFGGFLCVMYGEESGGDFVYFLFVFVFCFFKLCLRWGPVAFYWSWEVVGLG
jgi:hypothetical protein